MKTLKKIGIAILAILLLLVIIGLILPNDMTVEAQREIKAPKTFVYNYMNNLKNVPQYNAWVLEDPEINLTYGDTYSGQGATYSWESEQSGKGSIVYNSSTADSIKATMNFEGMGDSELIYSFAEKDAKTTQLSWTMNSDVGFPFNLMKWFFKRSIKKSYEKSFDQIEKVMEKRLGGEYYGYKVNEVPRKDMFYLMNRDEVTFENIQRFQSLNQAAIFDKINQAGLVTDGSPTGLFYNYDEEKGVADMAAAIPVLQEVTLQDLSSYTIPANVALQIDYYGDSEGSMAAHEAMDAYMNDRNLLTNVPVVEEYVTDPLTEKDPSKWLTKIIYYFSPKN